jgi:DNA-binding winged helix-turn-helix (wHTH) protein
MTSAISSRAGLSNAAATRESSLRRFGGFELQPAERRLLTNGQPVALGARAFDLLVVLVERAGQLVAKNDLLTLVWPGLVVEENNLQVQISTLRKVLGQSALATIPGRGYRFELPVEGADTAVPAAEPSGSPAAVLAAASEPARARTNLPTQPLSLYVRARDLVGQHRVELGQLQGPG